MEYGALLVIMPLGSQMQELCADSLATMTTVSVTLRYLTSEHIVFPAAGSVIAGAFYGQGTGLVHARNVGCIGNESSIFDCTYSRDTTYNPHTQDVSVRCQIGRKVHI